MFSRFGVTEAPTRRALCTIVELLQQYEGAPTFFIPAVVLGRHPRLIKEIANSGAEIGMHGYVHNDYRTLSHQKQYEQTSQAIKVFEQVPISFTGVRNPYLGWNEDAIQVYKALNLTYESNEAVLHDVVALDTIAPLLRDSYEKSKSLYQVLPCTYYALRPHIEDSLVRVPLSVPDDEMLFDRLHLTSGEQIGQIWGAVMQRVYERGGIYTLNLHPERANLCARALTQLLSCARSLPHPVWITRIDEVAQWWKERRQFRLKITRQSARRWLVEPECTPRASLLVRQVLVDYQEVQPWSKTDIRINPQRCIVHAQQCPCIGLSQRTAEEVAEFLHEQGYPFIRCTEEEADAYAYYLDLPQGLGKTREEQISQRSAIMQHVETMDVPFVHFATWPDGYYAALCISGDIDSITIQDFFLRILEVRKHAHQIA